jgi:phosphatidylethanolamine/phosphatidyl-N-methylethanolamine N-methyltransferase
MLKDSLFYLKESFGNFHYTGSICATSKWAADRLSLPLNDRKAPAQILELGAGTGAVTFEILKKLVPGDKLTICEINESFMKRLKDSLEKDENYHKHKDQIDFFLGPIQEMPVKCSYDILITSLPFLNFEPKTVAEIFTKLESLSSKEAVMTYYEYIGLRELGKRFSSKDRRYRLKHVEAFFKEREPFTRIDKEPVWLNILPIHIHTVRVHPINSEFSQSKKSVKEDDGYLANSSS